jgi:hypothetical protein
MSIILATPFFNKKRVAQAVAPHSSHLENSKPLSYRLCSDTDSFPFSRNDIISLQIKLEILEFVKLYVHGVIIVNSILYIRWNDKNATENCSDQHNLCVNTPNRNLRKVCHFMLHKNFVNTHFNDEKKGNAITWRVNNHVFLLVWYGYGCV